MKTFAQLIPLQLNIFQVRLCRVLLVLLSRRHIAVQNSAFHLIFQTELVSTAPHSQLFCIQASEWANSFRNHLSVLLVLHVCANLNAA
jgi:hypothetical protein